MKKLFTTLALFLLFGLVNAQEYPQMILVEGGTFTMGDSEMEGSADELPAHDVTLKTFSIAKTETTVLQWKTFCNATGRTFPSEMADEVDEAPMAYVSWYDAVAYTDWLADKTGKNYRLPTEAEWEYAARGGNKSKGYKYSGGRSLDNVGWFADNSGRQTHKVGYKQPNELGIYDMSGNLWEWCKDWSGEDYYGKSTKDNPKGPATGTYRVWRGGSWDDTAAGCRIANRNGGMPENRGYYCGFRVVLSQ
ncbi:formylglycine-generating enzyme family protein [Rhizosphaericola mali]|uniref:Formylglycine-generating enzyme family protein n=1 Tax=Rhizosphaericola mali TaxID=2545455 RepID=A0A5P2G8H2_9BACT|nr:SUMF1/EgtB/PvdO family nonheme iron enzyme [Rhizosphaericola mali]QES89513.1 formylglycine-generating enzyme family protein [Rhizosphaericola mali]